MKKIAILFLSLWPLMAAEIYATFKSEAVRYAHLSLQATGVVEQVYVQSGDRVAAGDRLLVLESREAKAEYDQAKSRYERFKKVRTTLSAEEFETHEAAYFRARANLDYHQALLDNRRLKAPFSGVIARRSVHEGDLIQHAQPGAFLLLEDEKSRLIVSFDQRHLGRVAKGDRFVFELHGQPREGRIRTLYPAVDSDSRKAQAEVLISGVPHGLFGEGRILKADDVPAGVDLFWDL